MQNPMSKFAVIQHRSNYMTKENKKVSIKLSVKDPREHWWKRRGKNNKNDYRLIMGK